MNKHNKTLWMGNIEPWMNHTFLIALLNSINIFPLRTIVKNPSNKRGCAFLEFNSPEMAQFVLTEYNNKVINGIQFKFNWVHSLEQKYNCSQTTKFTVRIFNIFYF